MTAGRKSQGGIPEKILVEVVTFPGDKDWENRTRRLADWRQKKETPVDQGCEDQLQSSLVKFKAS